MAWDPIDSAELNPGYPVLKHMRKAWNCLQYLFGQAGTLAGLNIQNGSFEINADGNNVPDTWTWSGFPGGTIAMDTTTPAHGSAGIAINHPGGSGNGGGELSSDYTPCSQLKQIFVQFIHWASAASMHNVVYISWYSKAKIIISTDTLYDSTTNPTSPRLIVCAATPPANARYYKIRINGGLNDSSVAGTAYFDDVKEVETVLGSRSPFTMGEILRNNGSWADLNSATLYCWRPGVPIQLVFPAEASPSGGSCRVRFRIGSYYSNEVEFAATFFAYTTSTFTLNAVTSANPATVIYMQAVLIDASSMYLRKSDSSCYVYENMANKLEL